MDPSVESGSRTIVSVHITTDHQIEVIGRARSRSRLGFLCLFLLLLIQPVMNSRSTFAEDPPFQYVVTDITDWSETQLSTIPFFRHLILNPPLVSPAITFNARNQAGVTVGELSATLDHYACYYSLETNHLAPALGGYHWGYWQWDGTDWHYYFGTVEFARLFDVNASGIAVGESTVPGSGESTIAWGSVAVYTSADDPTTLTVVTPGHYRSSAGGVSNNGTIVGWVRDESSLEVPFRLVDGLSVEYLVTPGDTGRAVRINSSDIAIGQGTDPNTSRLHALAFPATSATAVDIGLPATGPADAASAYDINDSDIICGASWDQAQFYEHYATVWFPEGNNQWSAWDINEMLTTNDHLLENARAINDMGLIYATGRPDGSDAYGSHQYILAPEGLVWQQEPIPTTWSVF